jgi:DNA-binding NtrC family response regulator
LIGPELIATLDQRSRPVQAFEPEKRKATWLDSSDQKTCPLCDPAGLLAMGTDLPMKDAVAQITAQVERAMLVRSLALTHGNKAQAARLLRIDYKTIHSKLKTYEISSIQFMKDEYKHREGPNGD